MWGPPPRGRAGSRVSESKEGVHGVCLTELHGVLLERGGWERAAKRKAEDGGVYGRCVAFSTTVIRKQSDFWRES